MPASICCAKNTWMNWFNTGNTFVLKCQCTQRQYCYSTSLVVLMMWYSNVAIMKFNKCSKIEIDLRCNDSCCNLHSLSISAELTKPIHVSYFFLHGLPCCYLRHFSAIFLVAWVTLVVPLMCVRFGSYPSLSLRTSISASSSHSLLVVLLVLSLLPRSLHHATELVWPQFFPKGLTGILLSHNTPLHLFQFLNASLASSILESRYLKRCPYHTCQLWQINRACVHRFLCIILFRRQLVFLADLLNFMNKTYCPGYL